jgi:hypothetical protein
MSEKSIFNFLTYAEGISNPFLAVFGPQTGQKLLKKIFVPSGRCAVKRSFGSNHRIVQEGHFYGTRGRFGSRIHSLQEPA